MSRRLKIALEREGILYSSPSEGGHEWLAASTSFSSDADRVDYLNQLEELELALAVGDAQYLVPWSAVYKILGNDELFPPAGALPLPPIDPAVVPALRSHGTLSDPKFRIEVVGWHRVGVRFADHLTLVGPAARDESAAFMLDEPVFRLIRSVNDFAVRAPNDIGTEANKLAWASIRSEALAAGAVLDKFLRTTVVLKPSMLRLGLERVHSGDDVAVRVTPTFDDAPSQWLRRFDRFRDVKPSYQLVEEGGEYVDVIIDPAVEGVLREIKRLPNRMALGERARQLTENPRAYFGSEFSDVLDEVSIEVEGKKVREGSWLFRAQISRDENGRLAQVGVELEQHGADETRLRLFGGPEDLERFLNLARSAYAEGRGFVRWGELDLEFGSRSKEHLEALAVVLAAWEAEPEAEQTLGRLIAADMVLDLSRYQERIESIGVLMPYGIINIPLSRKGAWLPEGKELELLAADGSPLAALDRESLSELVKAVERAEERKHDSVTLSNGVSMPLRQARDVVDALPKTLLDEVRPPADVSNERKEPAPRVGLVIKPNIDHEDFVTRRDIALKPPDGAAPLLPQTLRAGIQLKDHQLDGLLWLQHLYSHAPRECRGALLADDMGLGKTLQTLTLIARAREDDPDMAPALIIAPVTLLENWAQEIDRFFQDDSLPLLTLYGGELKTARVSKSDIDERLQRDGMRKFLSPGWQEDAAVVLTTYETLRDYEFSFSDVKWSVVVCDEAQRIKNPNALVSRAAKKLSARFCVAATGTPVENNLTDLWSLFDFIQPGLLEPLNKFNGRYRRPIEAKTDEQAARVDELRHLIDPQTLRRTKQDVARDLPRKVLDEDCHRLSMSRRQSELYDAVLAAQSAASEASQNGTEILQLISALRRICTDPRSARELREPLPPLHRYRAVAPKLDWLLVQLERIRDLDEKAIVFMDRKDIQRLVQHYIREHFGFAPEIINGETPTGALVPDSRQKRIDRFQAHDGFNVLILSPVAAGVGLNIQQANHVIHYMRHWNPAKEDQATDRAYRIGQQRDVTVYTPIVRGDGWVSFDERLDELLEKKRMIARDVLNGCDDVGAAEFADLLSASALVSV